MKNHCFFLKILCLAFTIFISENSIGQAKEVKDLAQVWVGFLSTTKLNNQLSILAEAHLRRTDFLAKPSFFIIRVGAQYQVNKKLSFNAGYGNMWLAPNTVTGSFFSQERRLFEQVQLNTKWHTINVVNRIRNEQRWQQKVANDAFSGAYRFSNRVRYMFGATAPIFKKSNYPLLIISNEIMFQFGNENRENVFDQNRFFVGLRKKISQTMAFDLGYLEGYQKKISGYQFERLHTLRTFFYYTPDLRHKTQASMPE